MSIYFDDIIFKLQYGGGITRYWKEVANHDNSKRGIRVFAGLGLKLRGHSTYSFLKFIPIIHVNSKVYHSSYQRPLLFKGSTKIVLTIHDCIYERFESGLRKWIHKFFTSWAIRQADIIIAVSKSTAEDIVEFYSCDMNKIRVIHNGSDNDTSSSEVSDISTPYLLYVGNRGYCKNFSGQMHLAAEFLAVHDKFKMVIVGGGALSRDEMSLINLLGISDRVVQFQGLTNAELRFVYQHAHVLLIQSVYEGFGIPVVEAARLGCPVLCSNESSFPEIVGSEYPGMIGISDRLDAMKFLEELLNSGYRKSIQQRLLIISKRFSWKKSHGLHLEIYNELLC